MKDKKIMVCEACKGSNITEFSSATWNLDKQCYDYEYPDYNGLEYCSDCDGECTVIEIDYVPSLEDYENSQKEEWSVVRFCDDTKEAMATGWCWGDGEAYNKYECDVTAELRKNPKAYDLETNNGDGTPRSDSDILNAAFHLDIVYYTEWFCDYSDALSDDDVCDSEKECLRRLLGILVSSGEMNETETKQINEALENAKPYNYETGLNTIGEAVEALADSEPEYLMDEDEVTAALASGEIDEDEAEIIEFKRIARDNGEDENGEGV